MLENIISGAAVAALGGLGFFAYNHPKEYRQIYTLITGLVAAAMLYYIGWTGGFRSAGEVAKLAALKVEGGGYGAINLALVEGAPDWRLVPAICFGLAVYFFFLRYYVARLKDHEGSEPESEKKD